MPSDGQIVFEITADNRDAVSEIRETTRVIQQESRHWSDSADEATGEISGGFASMLKKIGGAIAAAKIGQKFLEIGREAIGLASDLQEVQNVVDATFGSNAGQIDTWAKKAATQFGLTETQAKRFTSTLGAMMKSSGLAGSEIVDMSTDLAGLAADMASFYNLDFDTAFQKIRSGISGETEPLKQLGINMSVANLNAYALEKGLSKTFEQMSQGEQIMLRYQYMMDATADAQGDFARTSDGYANSMRAIETNIDSLKTKLGEVLLPAVNDIVAAVNDLFGSGAEEKAKKFSILDRINEIQIQKDAKITEIQLIAKEANGLIEALATIAGDTSAASTLTSLAEGANSLNSDSKANWTGILGALRGINGLENLFGEGETATATVNELAAALSGNSISTSKAQAWDTFLSALGDNADAVSSLTGQSAEATKEWLEGIRQEAEKLDPADAAAWQTLMTSLISGIDLNTEGGQQFIDQLAAQFLAMGSGSEEAVAGLAALGYTTDDISVKQQAWLEICKELEKTIPGIGDLIDDQTGEIKGGLPTLTEYVDEWERAQKIQAEIQAIGKMQDIFEEENDLTKKKSAMLAARAKFIAYLGSDETYNSLYGQYAEIIASVIEGQTDAYDALRTADKTSVRLGMSTFNMDKTGVGEAYREYVKAAEEYYVTIQELPILEDIIVDEKEKVADAYGMELDELEALTDAERTSVTGMTKVERAAAGEAQAIEEIATAANNASEALEALANYVDSVHDKILNTLDGLTSGFEKIETPMMKNEQDMKDLTKQIDALDSSSETYEEDLAKLNEQMNKAGAARITAQSMGANLKQQAEYMDTYLANLRKARELGVSDEVLAQLADGSEESYDYLAALAQASPDEVARINAGFEEVAAAKKRLADELTTQRLTVDQTYQTLAEAAKAAVAELDLEEEATTNAGKTVEGISKGIASKIPGLQSEIDAVLAQLNRLNGWGINLSLGNFGNISYANPEGSTRGGETLWSNKSGIDYVPYDNYLSRLHEGEAVLTAEENKVWQSIRNGMAVNVDYDSLGGVMRDNIRPGGNVYLDGRVVGSVISDGQGRSYRSLQRSGWQQ